MKTELETFLKASMEKSMEKGLAVEFMTLFLEEWTEFSAQWEGPRLPDGPDDAYMVAFYKWVIAKRQLH